VPFSALIGWVFLTTDKIGDWSENPFEGLHNDVPISSMARGIERDIREMLGERELPPARTAKDHVLF
jgi:putative membrane protein